MHPFVSIEYQGRGSPSVHLLIEHSDDKSRFELYNLSSVAGREEACSVHTAVTVIAYIDAAGKNLIACSLSGWSDARLPSPPYYHPTPAAKTIEEVEDAIKRFIRADAYVRETLSRRVHEPDAKDEGQDDEDYGDMPALEPFTHSEDEGQDEEDYMDMPALESLTCFEDEGRDDGNYEGMPAFEFALSEDESQDEEDYRDMPALESLPPSESGDQDEEDYRDMPALESLTLCSEVEGRDEEDYEGMPALGCALAEDEGRDEEDYGDMPALESFTHY